MRGHDDHPSPWSLFKDFGQQIRAIWAMPKVEISQNHVGIKVIDAFNRFSN
jgi:hypothetical protein